MNCRRPTVQSMLAARALRKRGLAHAGHILHQDVTLRQDDGESGGDDLIEARKHRRNRLSDIARDAGDFGKFCLCGEGLAH